MTVPKITETRCRDGNVQAKLIIQSLQSNPIPTTAQPCHVGHYRLCIRKDVGMYGVTSVAIV